jgi:hypothetical protein
VVSLLLPVAVILLLPVALCSALTMALSPARPLLSPVVSELVAASMGRILERRHWLAQSFARRAGSRLAQSDAQRSEQRGS